MTLAEVATIHANQDREVRFRNRMFLRGISWETYCRLVLECENLHIKMTFDRGALEIMSPLPEHEIATRFIDRLISVLSDECEIPISGYRATTWKRLSLQKGLEADECYYVANVKLADQRGAAINIDRDPPPDLAVEADITHGTIDKEAVYAALGVPELWRWDRGGLHIRLLGADGKYADAERGKAFPMLPAQVVTEFVHRRMNEGEWDTKKAFRDWVRTHLKT